MSMWRVIHCVCCVLLRVPAYCRLAHDLLSAHVTHTLVACFEGCNKALAATKLQRTTALLQHPSFVVRMHAAQWHWFQPSIVGPHHFELCRNSSLLSNVDICKAAAARLSVARITPAWVMHITD
jgi:hypothetical protein